MMRTRTWIAAVVTILALPAIGLGAPRPGPDHIVPLRAVAAPSGGKDLCTRLPWACAGGAGPSVAPESAMGLARKINRAVNREVNELSDRRQYGRADVWALPTNRGGDCEDFALAKKKRLIDAGVPARSLLMATVLDRRRNPHAVLVLRTRGKDFVLDNLTDRMLAWQETGYSFLRMQDSETPANWNVIAAGGIFGLDSRPAALRSR